MGTIEDPTAPPVVLVFAGHDPTGGAGIQADIETLAAQGCHAAPVVTALTVQDTRDVRAFHPVDPRIMAAQAEAVLGDMPVRAIKIGMLGSVEVAKRIAGLLRHHAGIPVVLDPVLRAGGGGELASRELSEVIVAELMGSVLLATPNGPEARQLVPEAETLADCADRLLAAGADSVLITGTHEAGELITHRLWTADGGRIDFHSPRLAGEYHGSGCTLASAIAAGVAQGKPLEQAVGDAQAFTLRSLEHGFHAGGGQRIPNRFFWGQWPR
ncbi:MAG: hydroxymethylpyrimidine/phosphomethylpyrimidine kinase [Gammaproteobacteria bacterium]